MTAQCVRPTPHLGCRAMAVGQTREQMLAGQVQGVADAAQRDRLVAL